MTELFNVAVCAPACGATDGASPRGRPKLTGVESERNRGKPAGRSSGTISNTPTAKTCKPNEVKVVSPKRERSSHEEFRVLSNMVSSSKTDTAKDTKPCSEGSAGAKKKAAFERSLWELSRHTRCHKTTWVARLFWEPLAWALAVLEPQAWEWQAWPLRRQRLAQARRTAHYRCPPPP